MAEFHKMAVNTLDDQLVGPMAESFARDRAEEMGKELEELTKDDAEEFADLVEKAAKDVTDDQEAEFVANVIRKL